MHRQSPRQAPPGTYNKEFDLKGMRQAAGLTQGQVCEMLGIQQATLSRYESGQIKASADMVRNMAQIYRRDIDHLLARHPDNLSEMDSAIALLKKAKPEDRNTAVRAIKAILHKEK